MTTEYEKHERCRTCGAVSELDSTKQCGVCSERATMSVYSVGGRA